MKLHSIDNKIRVVFGGKSTWHVAGFLSYYSSKAPLVGRWIKPGDQRRPS